MASKRAQLSDEFIAELASDWQQHGAAALEKVREKQPARYVALIADLVPKEMLVAASGHEFDGKSLDEMRDILIEGMSHRIPEYEGMLKRARQIAQEREATRPPELPADRRARLAREAQRQQGSNGQWARSG